MIVPADGGITHDARIGMARAWRRLRHRGARTRAGSGAGGFHSRITGAIREWNGSRL
ncbi:MAG: hypothetical protein LBD06_11915 [Candidatus Accumulibacter sp.]|nr:hypothetical protein [Accumulibacter sp.]